MTMTRPAATRFGSGGHGGTEVRSAKKEFKRQVAEQIPSLRMELGEYDHQAVEAAARALWESHDIYSYDSAGQGPVFSVDTPPPYVSAAHLHVGHAMSYSQPDFIVRYRRMRGERVFYPIGFDDNGLPTERYVEQAYGVRAVDLPRAEFVALCLAETQRTAERYEDLWRRLGLSLDWSLRYSTIDVRCQRTAQTSFIKLHQAGHLRRAADPILWCPEDRTSLAQADVEDLERTSRLHTIRFSDGLLIATTRPELLPACVALYHHPSDARYSGRERAVVPLFDYEVPVLTVRPSPRRSPRQGCWWTACRYGRSSGCTSDARPRSSSRSGRSGSSRSGSTRTGSGRARPSSSGSRRSCGGASRTGSTGSSGTGTSPGSGVTACRSRSGSARPANTPCWPGSRTCRWTR